MALRAADLVAEEESLPRSAAGDNTRGRGCARQDGEVEGIAVDRQASRSFERPAIFSSTRIAWKPTRGLSGSLRGAAGPASTLLRMVLLPKSCTSYAVGGPVQGVRVARPNRAVRLALAPPGCARRARRCGHRGGTTSRPPSGGWSSAAGRALNSTLPAATHSGVSRRLADLHLAAGRHRRRVVEGDLEVEGVVDELPSCRRG